MGGSMGGGPGGAGGPPSGGGFGGSSGIQNEAEENNPLSVWLHVSVFGRNAQAN
jgi:hypothetical protein